MWTFGILLAIALLGVVVYNAALRDRINKLEHDRAESLGELRTALASTGLSMFQQCDIEVAMAGEKMTTRRASTVRVPNRRVVPATCERLAQLYSTQADCSMERGRRAELQERLDAVISDLYRITGMDRDLDSPTQVLERIRVDREHLTQILHAANGAAAGGSQKIPIRKGETPLLRNLCGELGMSFTTDTDRIFARLRRKTRDVDEAMRPK